MFEYFTTNFFEYGIVTKNILMRTANPAPTTVIMGITITKHNNLHINPQSLIHPIPMQGAHITATKKAIAAPMTIIKAITSTSSGKANIIPIKFNKAFSFGIDYSSL